LARIPLHLPVVVATITMRVSFDPKKRDHTLEDRRVAFGDAALAFEGTTVEIEDLRGYHGERRIIC
jgi:uncharacterized DUF497 family protein